MNLYIYCTKKEFLFNVKFLNGDNLKVLNITKINELISYCLLLNMVDNLALSVYNICRYYLELNKCFCCFENNNFENDVLFVQKYRHTCNRRWCYLAIYLLAGNLGMMYGRLIC